MFYIVIEKKKRLSIVDESVKIAIEKCSSMEAVKDYIAASNEIGDRIDMIIKGKELAFDIKTVIEIKHD